MKSSGLVASALCAAAIVVSTPAGAQQAAPAAAPLHLSAAQLFALGDAARDRGDTATAETAYRALTHDPDPRLRTEARFRLGMMLADREHKYREAAVLFREILDEDPKAARVRIELARMLALMGSIRSAERELRAAEASGLPPQVEQLVRFYANALNARKPFGGSFEVSIAPDTNINRATRSETLSTVIGDFTLDQDARARSGVGLSVQGQAYVRTAIDARATLLAQLSASGDFYRDAQFDQHILSLQVGPQYVSGKDRLSAAGVVSELWFGLKPYTVSYGVTGDWQHPLGKRAQAELSGTVIHVDDQLNDLRDADRFTLVGEVDRAVSARFGGGLRVTAYREAARDPGYATASGGVTGYVFRELGKTTAVLSVGYSHLEADRRLALYPRRRVDDRVVASLSATFRALKVGSFAPLARITAERNYSTVGIYDYRRLAGEVGITAAF